MPPRAGIFALLAAVAAAAPVVWRAASPAGALEVYADDTYALFASDGAAWLESGPTAVHVAGQWFSSDAAGLDAGACSSLPDTDCRNQDLYFFNSTDAAACCANCSATPSCGAWTWTGVTDSAGRDGAPPVWANRCYIKSGCDYQSYAGHASGLPPAALPAALTRLGAGPSSDGSGGYDVRYSASNGSVLLTVSFALDNATNAFVFTQSFPLGAAGVNILTPSNSTVAGAAAPRPHGPLAAGEFASSTTPSTQFPVFREAANSSAAERLGFLSWGGRFFGSYGSAAGGADAAFGQAAAGAESGPIALFDGASGRALVLSPLDNFKGSMVGRPRAGSGAAAGVSGYATSLPANFSTSTIAFFGADGVTDAVHAWGSALLARHGGAPKVKDPSSEQLTCKCSYPPRRAAAARHLRAAHPSTHTSLLSFLDKTPDVSTQGLRPPAPPTRLLTPLSP